MAIVITQHAINRFIQRHAPEMSYDQAKRHLQTESRQAAHLRNKSVNGQSQWRLDNPNCILVMKRDGRDDICVTVLPYDSYGDPSELGYDDVDAEVDWSHMY